MSIEQNFILLLTAIILSFMGFLLRGQKKAESLIEAEREAKKIADRASIAAEKLMEDARQLMKETREIAKEEKAVALEEFKASTKSKLEELRSLEEKLTAREKKIEANENLVQKNSAEINQLRNDWHDKLELVNQQKSRLEASLLEQKTILEGIAQLSREDAREKILADLDRELSNEKGSVIRDRMAEINKYCDKEAQSIITNAIQRYAGDCTYQRTSAMIHLPNDEMKGRIIGREGRNIRTIEACTGASVLVDDIPDTVVISCFDPIRKEVAKISMQRLVEDGRIHPTRIEETVEAVKIEIENEVLKAGQAAIDQLNLVGINDKLIKLIGQLKYRYSYSQNVLMHSIEVASTMGMIAAELGLDESKAKRMGLLHDIGKAVDHKIEGSHAVIGADILRRSGEDPEVINGVECHHGDVTANSPLAVLVAAADTISAGRPGARSETTEIYLKRLQKLEEIGTSFHGVNECFAIQGGRELRIIVNASEVKENQAYTLAREISNRIEMEMKYPGQIKVTILRETRAVEYAK
jgi:ribonuclease Y